MPLKNYGVLKGRPIDSRLGFGRSPHYQWVAIFLAFQSQCWHTDDVYGHCLGTADQPAEEKDVVIVAAMVNPPGHDPGKEKVLLLNTTADH